ncbi:MAG: peptide chain release factor N(5)-glutamine methyltransferase [Bdellovibrionales bacterium]
MTIADLLENITNRFREGHLEQPQFEARQLLAEFFKKNLAWILVSEQMIDVSEAAEIQRWVERRLQGEPLAYLTGFKGFGKARFRVGHGVLIPRPETEHVLEVALRRTLEKPQVKIADFGCGTGCIGLSFLLDRAGATLVAIDASAKAIEYTRKNAEELGVGDRCQTFQGRVQDWSGPAMDVIVSNPPYVAQDDPRVEAHVRKFEPAEALFSSGEGLDALKQWAGLAHRHLVEGGLYVCEFGAGQEISVEAIMKDAGFESLEFEKDYAGIMRVVSGMKPK